MVAGEMAEAGLPLKKPRKPREPGERKHPGRKRKSKGVTDSDEDDEDEVCAAQASLPQLASWRPLSREGAAAPPPGFHLR